MADQNDLPRTIAALRREVPMRPEWRRAVLHHVEHLPLPPERPSPTSLGDAWSAGWRVRPALAIAAGIMCAVAGGLTTLGVQRLTLPPEVANTVSALDHGPAAAAPVRFVLVAPTASRVAIVGDFNGWDATATPLRRTSAGLWSVDLRLPSGRHAYAFVVDGVVIPDPNALDSADDDFGVRSSVVLVSDDRRT